MLKDDNELRDHFSKDLSELDWYRNLSSDVLFYQEVKAIEAKERGLGNKRDHISSKDLSELDMDKNLSKPGP